ncbi:MAG TPA: AMP-binding protein [Allocoleopsis sp.]
MSITIPGNGFGWHNLQQEVDDDCSPEIMNSDDVLFILYTSGTNAKSKEVVHTTGGYNLYTHITAKWVFDFQENDVYWCTADIGWITGHSYVVYGPLSNGVTTFICEDYSETETVFKAIAKHGINIFYTTPAVISNLSQIGAELPKNINLSSLRLLGSVGECLNPSLWEWYYHVMGGSNCPIVDTWWQTETGGIMIAPKPGITSLLPGSCTLPLPGIMADINENGELIIKKPWPGMMRNLQLDHTAYYYLTGDSAYRDESENIWIRGRIDDVIKLGKIPLTSLDIESVLISHPAVKEVAVISKYLEFNKSAIWAFVVLNDDYDSHSTILKEELKTYVSQKIGKFACPDEICFTPNLLKTPVGKIQRGFLRFIVNNQEMFADVSILENAKVLEEVENTYRYFLTSKV